MKLVLPRWSRWRGATAVLVGALGVSLLAAAPAHADATPAGAAVPAHVFAPYYYRASDTSTSDQLNTVSTASGAKYITLAFLQTATKGSCTVYWNGKTSTPVGTTYAASIAAIRAAGGDVFPSFGGSAAGGNGTELADSCTDVDSIAAEFERVITTYNFTRIDLDIEADSLTLTDGTNPGIDRRNQAVKKVEDWAKASGRALEFVYTQPTWTTGLNAGSTYLLQSAISNGTRIDGVNVMTFDYYDDVSDACAAKTGPAHDMAADTVASATSLYNILHAAYPSKTSAQIWGMIGVIEMPGKSDFDGDNKSSCEVFSIQNAATVLTWATQQNIKTVSYWSLQGDKSGTGGSTAAYQFAQTFAPFTHNDPPADEKQETVTATVPEVPGEFSWTIDSDDHSVDLGTATNKATYWESTGDLKPVKVTDTRAGKPAWSISGQASDFSGGLSGQYLGWSPTVITPGAGAVAGSGVDPGLTTGNGLKDSANLASAPEGHAKGTGTIGAGLVFQVPIDTDPGTYTATLTLTALS